MADFFKQRTEESEELLTKVDDMVVIALDALMAAWYDINEQVDWAEGDTVHIKRKIEDLARSTQDLHMFIGANYPDKK